jgi:tetratricopeptide (TPR) repeat protein
MEKLYQNFPDDKEAAIFYALALNATANPSDKTYTNQKKAGALLYKLFPDQPDHPGLAHYIIHNYDYPELAGLALEAARRYAAIAPASAHAQHMPSHIFTRLGLWDESIASNLTSVSAAQCYADNVGMEGHWDEELHGMDYLVYAYLQKAQDDKAKAQVDYLKTIHHFYPENFKVAYALAAIPARFALERKQWEEAAHLAIHSPDFSLDQFPWQQGIIYFTRVLGSLHTGDKEEAYTNLEALKSCYNKLVEAKDDYKAKQVLIQIKASEAWIRFAEGQEKEALELMISAAEMEDATEKHPVTPGEVIPARELLGDLLMKMDRVREALQAYETSMKRAPNRFNGLLGAAQAADRVGDKEKARLYYEKLVEIAGENNLERPGLMAAKTFLGNNRD